MDSYKTIIKTNRNHSYVTATISYDLFMDLHDIKESAKRIMYAMNRDDLQCAYEEGNLVDYVLDAIGEKEMSIDEKLAYFIRPFREDILAPVVEEAIEEVIYELGF